MFNTAMFRVCLLKQDRLGETTVIFTRHPFSEPARESLCRVVSTSSLLGSSQGNINIRHLAQIRTPASYKTSFFYSRPPLLQETEFRGFCLFCVKRELYLLSQLCLRKISFSQLKVSWVISPWSLPRFTFFSLFWGGYYGHVTPNSGYLFVFLQVWRTWRQIVYLESVLRLLE